MSKRKDKIKSQLAANRTQCTVKANLLKYGYAIDTDVVPGALNPNNGPVAVFDMALRQLQHMPAILDPIERVRPNEILSDWTSCRPPFELQYIETVMDDVRLGCIVGCEVFEQDENPTVMLIGFGQHKDNVNPQPKAMAWMRMELDEKGTAIKKVPAPLFLEKNDGASEAQAQYLYSYAITRTIQIMTAGNIGLHENVSPSARNPRTPRYIRQQLMAERYHTLVVRDPRTQRVIYTNRPDGQKGKMPLHVARGHWAKYGPDYNAGLAFGKLAGRFWVPEAEKGRSSNGVIKKDYVVDANQPHAGTGATNAA